MRTLTVAGLGLAASLLACADDSVVPVEELHTLRVEGRVLDEAGAPVADGRVIFSAWYASNLKERPAHPFPTPYAATGADGRFVLSVDPFAGGAVDSIALLAFGPGCSPDWVRTVISREELPDGPVGELSLDLPAGAAATPTVTAVGDVCAQADHPSWGPLSMWVVMRIDSLRGEMVYGRWRIDHRSTDLGAAGRFEGVQRNGLLVLAMHADDYGRCTELRLAIPVGAGGEWGQAGVLRDDGCLPGRGDLTFALESEIRIAP